MAIVWYVLTIFNLYMLVTAYISLIVQDANLNEHYPTYFEVFRGENSDLLLVYTMLNNTIPILQHFVTFLQIKRVLLIEFLCIMDPLLALIKVNR